MNAEALLRNTSDGVSGVGPDGRIVFWNKAAEAILEYPASAVIGQQCWGVFSGCDVNGNRLCVSPCPVRLLLSRGDALRHFTMGTRTRSGEPRWLDVSTLFDPGGPGRPSCTVHVFRDVTAAHHLQTLVKERLADVRPPRAQVKARTGRLTAREKEILELLRTGATTVQIAHDLRISRATVRNHLQNLFSKLEVHSRLAAVACTAPPAD